MALSVTAFSRSPAIEFRRNRVTQSSHINPNCVSFCESSVSENGVSRHVASLLHSMDFTDPEECNETYAVVLRKCRKIGNLELGFQVHAHMVVCGVELCEFMGSQLLEMYCKLGCVAPARKLFDEMTERNVFSFTSMMEMYCRSGFYEETIALYYEMIGEGIRPDHFVFPKVFKACSELKDYEVGKDVYEYMISIEFEGNAYVRRAFLEMFVKCGRINVARRLFEGIKFKDIVMWNIMISGYASKGDFRKALRYVNEMRVNGVTPDQVTWNSIISGFAQNKRASEGFRILCELSDSEDFRPNVVSYTSVITGCEKSGFFSEALQLFRTMLKKGVRPNSVTISSIVSVCTKLSLSRKGKEIHCYCIKRNEFNSDLLVGNSLIDFYAKCPSLEVARHIFNDIKQKDVVSWNTMLSGYALANYYREAYELLYEMMSLGMKTDIITWNGLITGFTQTGNAKSALEFLQRMLREDINPNSTSLSAALAACAQMKDLKSGKEIHCFLTRHGIEQFTGIGSALISMYSRCESLDLSFSVFDEISAKDVVIWNSIIAACSQNNQGITALDLLREMNLENTKPDSVTIISVLRACSRLAALCQGKEIHQFIMRHGFDHSTFVWNALIDMYGRSGSIEMSRRVFDSIPQKDLVTWNVMISMYGMHGFGTEAVNLFEQMRITELKPNHVTFTNLFSACTHSGLVEEGHRYFKLVKEEFRMEPEIEQYACIVDLISRTGNFDESLEFIERMPFEPNAAIWGSILGACRIHSNSNVAEFAAKHLFELEPQVSGNYVLLANIFSASGRWDKAAEIRTLMKQRGVVKSPGCSWIEVKRKVNSFIVGEASHPSMNAISAKIESLFTEIKKLGYVPQTGFVLKNFCEDEKELSLCGHSEKFALAFGLTSTPARTPLRIIKNLRICGDCHTAAKFISIAEEREIIMRDNYRFHHFHKGVCSCGDYW